MSNPTTLTRRSFIKRAGVALAALGMGLKPSRQAPGFTQGGVVPKDEPLVLPSYGKAFWPYGRSPLVLDNFGIQDGDIVTAKFDGETHQGVVINMQKLDNAGVDTKKLRSLFDGTGTDPIIAARLIQELDPNDFDSLAQYSRCIADIAGEFGL